MRPCLSVVIASVNGADCILECLERLDQLPERERLEIIVLDRRDDDTAIRISKRFPSVLLTQGLRGRSIPELRWMGMQLAKADWIAVLEDHCMVTPTWATQILKYQESPYGVIGGPVENGSCDRLLDWACFLAEYSPCMPPLPEGEAEWVPGNNAAYRRDVLPLKESRWATVWESFLQQELRRLQVRMLVDKELLVYHKKSFRFSEMLYQRYLYSRSFAGMRACIMNAGARSWYAFASLALPALLILRIGQRVFAKRRNLCQFTLTCPVIALYVCSWAMGETVGYLFGAGESLSQVN